MLSEGAMVMLSALSAAGASGASALTGGNDVDIPIIRLFLGLILCVAVAIVAALAIRRMKAGPNIGAGFASLLTPKPIGREIEVREVHRLSAQAEAVRLHWAGSDYLVIVSNGAIGLIDKRSIGETTR